MPTWAGLLSSLTCEKYPAGPAAKAWAAQVTTGPDAAWSQVCKAPALHTSFSGKPCNAGVEKLRKPWSCLGGNESSA